MKLITCTITVISIILGICIISAGTPNRKLPSKVYYMSLDYEFGFEEAILTLEKDQAYTLSYHSKERSHLILGYYEYRGDTLDLYPKSYINRFWDCIAIGGEDIGSRGEKDSSFLIPCSFVPAGDNMIKALPPTSGDPFIQRFGWPFAYYDGLKLRFQSEQ